MVSKLIQKIINYSCLIKVFIQLLKFSRKSIVPKKIINFFLLIITLYIQVHSIQHETIWSSQAVSHDTTH